MPIVGLTLTAAAACYLLLLFLRAEKRARYPAYGIAGLGTIALVETLLFLDVSPVTVYFTPIVWSAYILAIDAAIFAVRGRSLLRSEPQAFTWMAVLSIFLWLIFELYNLRLVNWTYVGLPNNEFLRYLGYGWSFATIWPAVLSTTDFLLATRFRRQEPPPSAWEDSTDAERRPLQLESPASTADPPKRLWPWIALGLAMITVPLLVPRETGQYLFGSVWLGFIFLIDPLNYRAGQPSVWGDWKAGYRARLWALLIAGGVCGIFWEFWNYWASAKWLYIFPILEDFRIFEMPLPGYLGFPAFAVEIFALYVFAASLFRLPYWEPRP